MDRLVVGQRYLIRQRQTYIGPWGTAVGLQPFTLVSVEPNEFGHTEFRFRNETNGLIFAVTIGNDNWIFFNNGGGVLHPLIANAPNIGELVLPAGINANVIDMEPFKNGEAVVILQRPLFGDRHIFRESTISAWFNSNQPPTNPVTRAAITGNGDVVRATIKLPAVGGKRKRNRISRRTRRSRRSHRSRRRI